jgi:imidazoleglycerol-phosphate dehydratase
MNTRTSRLERETRETRIALALTLDGSGAASVDSGLGFLDHMLTALAMHGRMDLELRCSGDREVDDHHTVEDCALAIGSAVHEALGDKKGIRRFGTGWVPMDESLARAVVDVSGRPSAHVELGLVRDRIGAVACENITHFFESFATAARVTLHVDVLRGTNDHHKAEAAFKAVALALREAAVIEPGRDTVPSTKGVL